jgi:hypothetical protein
MPTVEENPSRTKKFFVVGTDNTHYGEHRSTFILSIYSSSRTFQKYCNTLFSPMTIIMLNLHIM